MPTEFGDPSYPGLGTAGVQSQGYVEKIGFSQSQPQFSPTNTNIHPNCNKKSLVGTLGYMLAEFNDPRYLGLITAGVQSQGYVSR